jgi:hypothetical protein
MNNDNPKLEVQHIYEEIGNNYRYFLNWRYGIVAAMIAISYFGLSFYFELLDKHISYSSYIPIGIIIIVSLLWLSEIKVRKLYRIAEAEGSKLEASGGFYKAHSIMKSSNSKVKNFFYGLFLSHSAIVNYLSIGIILLMIALWVNKPEIKILDNHQDSLIAKLFDDNRILRQSNDSLLREIYLIKMESIKNQRKLENTKDKKY